MTLDRGEVATEVGELVHFPQQLFNPNEGQAGINYLLQGGDSSGDDHFIIAFQFELSLLDLGKIVTRKPCLGPGHCVMELVGQDGFGLRFVWLLECRACGRLDLLPPGLAER
jgi:hypothetical protein